MPYKNLHEFIDTLDFIGELKRITAEVDPYLEITEIADRISKSGGPALLFEKVKASPFPLLINAFGSYRRMELALNCGSFDEIGNRIDGLLKIQPPQGIIDKIKMLFTLS
jgi:4-hydroxy-3-polyprenylbenzoate decarboxylase